ncbi:hypothetical protein DACRYDRAFT_17232 [Dacryopinax primogenitus]|uniref:Uncharacterized protein n=1 Tax=Dacryopinax primogenitus (strain DJM 731) TaxID=1858805 RepID=M5G705_DACPD|nr:uncharacterized protein DACRYDRAFT_17232 [Dacryopinax primogenitus]EJT99542.1 hypothetical protein DACRYDRAFT_17232 [Dacryopinax primogenitus]
MPTHMLTLGKDPAITYAFMDQLAAARPGMYTASTAHSPDEFETYAKNGKNDIDFVLLGAAQTDDQVINAKRIVANVWGSVKETLRQVLSDGGTFNTVVSVYDHTRSVQHSLMWSMWIVTPGRPTTAFLGANVR